MFETPQDALNSQEFLTRRPGHFLLGRAPEKGEVATTLQPITIAEMDAAQYPKRSRIDRLRPELMQRDGQDERVVARQIRCRLDSLPEQVARTSQPPRAPDISRRPEA